MTTITATGQEQYHQHFHPFAQGFVYGEAGNMEDILPKLTEDICAVLIELIQGEGGVNTLEKAFVQELAAICMEKDILLIIDEVQTGVGRTGTFFAYEQYGIQPDLVTSAKGLGGGLPIGAILFSEKTAGVLGYGDHGTTFRGKSGGLRRRSLYRQNRERRIPQSSEHKRVSNPGSLKRSSWHQGSQWDGTDAWISPRNHDRR